MNTTKTNELPISAAFSYETYRSALEEADTRMKASNGHEYLTILKTRCMHCGRSPRVKTRCGGWFQTFVNMLGHVLQEKGVITQPSQK
jgi:hypothetical protein